VGATPIDNNDADGKSGKLYGWLLIIRCTSSEDYYNIVFSDHSLNIDHGRLYAALPKEKVEKSAAVTGKRRSGSST